MVPMVFVYAPTMLIVLPEYFTLVSFLHVSLTCALGIFAIATAVSGYFLAPLSGMWRAVMAISGLLMVAPGWESDLTALIVAAPVIFMQVAAQRADAASTTAKVDSD